jgi:beta-glucanase (GH16 family)
MLVQATRLDEFHEYSVEWVDQHLIFRLDGVEIYRSPDPEDQFPEPLFAILNFAKINDSSMLGSPWVLEVDWVRHEVFQK